MDALIAYCLVNNISAEQMDRAWLEYGQTAVDLGESPSERVAQIEAFVRRAAETR